MTGEYPKTHGDRVYSDHMAMPDTTTLAQAFRNDGYQAYAVGKLHVYPQRDRIGFDDVVLMEEGRYEFGAVDDYQIWLGENGMAGEEFLHSMGNNSYLTRPWHLSETAHPTVWATRQMCRMIQRKDPTRPAFWYISYQFPHPPLVPLQSFLDMYDEDAIDMPEENPENWLDGSAIIKYLQEQAVPYTRKAIKRARMAFYAQCTLIDYQMRLLIGTLRERNLLKDTIIGFISDHGDSLFTHGMVGKRTFYRESCNVPFILSGEAISEYRGIVLDKLASLEDVMPTLLQLCGVPVPPTVEGMDILSSQNIHEHLYCEIGEGVKATRMATDGRYKLIYYPCGNIFQLFDRHIDPKENTNLYGIKEYSAISRELKNILLENLHGSDSNWFKNDKLVGAENTEYKKSADYGLYNQRGLHWPAPSEYNNEGLT